MFCSKCGSNIADDGKFCPNCGNPTTQNQTPNVPVYSGYVYPAAGQAPSQPGAYYAPPQPAPRKKSNAPLIIVLSVLAVAVIVGAVLLISSLISGFSNPTGGTSSTQILQPDGFRQNYTTIKGGGDDTYTVMIYICGADLETEGACGSIDIQEMLDANFGDNVNVILQTGGALDWSMEGITDGGVQRWQVKDGQLIELQELESQSMLTSSALSDFISFASRNYPANRNALILWDHGGGSLYGYGMDEMYPDTTLYLPNIAEALADAGTKFDIFGFDACLMGSVETAYMLEPFADYMVASEETEPSYGWDYSVWLTELGNNTSIDPVKLGQSIVDSFIDQNGTDSTLSVVALREIPAVYTALCNYMANADAAIAGGTEFGVISQAVAETKSFAEGGYDMIDIIDFTSQSEIEGKQALVDAVNSAVKYHNDCTVGGVNGLSLYFPYSDLTVYDTSKQWFSSFGFGGDVYKFYDSFVTILAGGQSKSDGASLWETLTDGETATVDYSTYDWYDQATVDNYDYADESIDYSSLAVLYDEINEYHYLPLTAADWELITEVQMQIMLDDGEGYIDLGSDQTWIEDDYGNLILNYGSSDNTWVAIGGQIVCYYAEDTTVSDDGTTTYTGYVPAFLNDTTDIQIILVWEKDADDNMIQYIAGYRVVDPDADVGDQSTLGKGYLQFYTGDKIEYVCDYYNYDGSYDAQYFFGDAMFIGDTLPEVSYEDVGEDPVLECYMIIDIYQNYSWTETVTFSLN